MAFFLRHKLAARKPGGLLYSAANSSVTAGTLNASFEGK
jgi:hypothetical protein